MKWRKLGLVFNPPKDVIKAASHAQVPTPLLLNDDVIRVYYCARDEQQRSRPYFVDIDAREPLKILNYSKNPSLDLGQPGCFDDNGVMPCSVIRLRDGRFHMYYVGFELFQNIRYKLFTGLAISEDGENFVRHSHVPILDRTNADLFFRGGPFVRQLENGFDMYYVAGSGWTEQRGKSMPVYVLKYMTSPDGIIWPDDGRVVVALTEEDEHGLGRPWVMFNDREYEIYYSVRRISFGAYRMGWATSPDGLNWNRRDREMGLDVTPDSFDSQAVMYAAVVTAHGRTYCFYNGNEFGVDGFAVAVREE